MRGDSQIDHQGRLPGSESGHCNAAHGGGTCARRPGRVAVAGPRH